MTNFFPRSEQFGVTSQLRLAAYSIPANMAEGYGRRSTKELLQFLSVANGSLEESRYFLSLSRDLRYLAPVDFEKIDSDLRAIAQMLEALKKSLRLRLANATRSNSSDSSCDTGHLTRTTKTSSEVSH